jgi:PDZ domain
MMTIEDRPRDDGFEATFVVRTPRDKAWELLRSATPASDELPPARSGQRWMPGWEGPADEIEVVPGERLRARKATWPCEGTEIMVVLEDEASGTRITLAQTGFGADFSDRRAWLASGWPQIVADVALYLERGVAVGRHLAPWAGLGWEVVETPGGLVVTSVAPGGFADRAGVQADDLIVGLAGSPVVDIRELSILMRGPLRSGTDTTVRYLRGNETLTGRGTI